MLSVSDLAMAFGGRQLFQELTFALKPGQRVGLVGPNGCGKTTLLKIAAGQEKPDQGTVSLEGGCELGYLGQEGQLEPDNTLYQEMALVFEPVFEMERGLRRLEGEMESVEGDQLEKLLKQYGSLQNRYETAEPHTIDARIRTVLAGVGFQERDLERLCREFSGGWQMKGAMARLLLGAPDVLLMDEPTNHLDLWAVEWLESYLSSYKGTVLMVSHDRTFLDRTVNRVLAFQWGKLEDYPGNYSYFLEESERRREAHQAAYRAQQKQLEKEERFIERFRSKATLASRVKSKQKQLEKRDLLEAPQAAEKALKASFSDGPASGSEVLKVLGVGKSYGDIPVFTDVSFELGRCDRLAMVGKNGAGKSTLLRLLAQQEEPDQGRIKCGFRLQPVYYAQHQAEALQEDATIMESVEEVAPRGTTQTRIRTLLGCLLFSGDEVYKPVGVLSGGERSRVALARCIIRPSNLLLLDEPTNHLDLSARESLLEALHDYSGTIVLVTHDRFFMDGLVERVLEIAEGRHRMFLGNYSRYREKVEQERRHAEARKKAEQEAAKKKTKKTPAKRQSHPKASRVEWKIEALEAKIFALEEELEQLTNQMADPELYNDPERHQKVDQRYHQVQSEVDELTEIWDSMTS